MTNRIGSRIIDSESIKSAAREWGGAYALLFSLQSLAYTATALWFGITDPPSDEFYPAFTAILRDIGIGGLASVVTTTSILEGAQSIMVIAATILKPRERRIREEGREEGRAQAAQAFEQERETWRAWYYLNEIARAKGEEPPPPPFFASGNGQSE